MPGRSERIGGRLPSTTRIMTSTGLSPPALVVEFGAGEGTLTAALLAAGVVAALVLSALAFQRLTGAAISALPAAWVYESYGSGPTWAAGGLTVLVLVVAGWLRIRGTVPASGPDAPAPRPD